MRRGEDITVCEEGGHKVCEEGKTHYHSQWVWTEGWNLQTNVLSGFGL